VVDHIFPTPKGRKAYSKNRKIKDVFVVSGLRGRRELIGIPATCCNLLDLQAAYWRHPLVLNSARR
jgi:hypothetical protein